MIVSENIAWSPGVTLETIEKQVILKAFAHFKEHRASTAVSLGIAVRTLDSKLAKYEYEQKLEEERQASATAKRAEFQARQRGNPPNNIGVPFTPTAMLPGSHMGARLESFANSTSKSEMPMPERSEIQAVLSKQASQSGKERRR